MIEMNPLKVANWDALVLAHPQHSIFHSTSWARVLVEAFGFAPRYLVEHNGSKMRTLVSMMEVRDLWRGGRGVGLPFTDECAPLLGGGRRETVLAEMIREGRNRGWRELEWRGGESLATASRPSVSFYSHRLNLTEPEEKLLAGLDGAVRRAVRKSVRAGVTVQVGTEGGGTERFYSLYCLTRRRHGLPPQPLSFFRSIQRHLLACGRGFIAEAVHQGKTVAAAVFFMFGRRAVFKYGASDLAWQHLRGNDAVMWEAIRWLRRHGFEQLHLGRTSLDNAGLRRFKLGWGCEEGLTHYYRYDLRQERFLVDKDPVYGWYNSIFRLLPIWLARLVGRMAYRYAA